MKIKTHIKCLKATNDEWHGLFKIQDINYVECSIMSDEKLGWRIVCSGTDDLLYAFEDKNASVAWKMWSKLMCLEFVDFASIEKLGFYPD